MTDENSLVIQPGTEIPLTEIEFSYARSSGPGGQNVNKVNTKAVLRWNLTLSPSLPASLRDRLLEKLQSKLTRDGEIVIASDRYRDQTRNREDALDKLQKLLSTAAQRPKPRKKTKPSRASQQRVQKAKTKHREKKQLRKTPRYD